MKAMPQIYEQGGDFAVATLIATQYGLAVLSHGGRDASNKLTSLRLTAWPARGRQHPARGPPGERLQDVAR